MNLIHGMLVILACQLAGEVIVQLADIAVPGPVIGMVLLFSALVIIGRVPVVVRRVSDTLLEYLALLFVPAGVGLMVHFPLIARDAVAIGVALVVSTAAALVTTLLVLAVMVARRRQRNG